MTAIDLREIELDDLAPSALKTQRQRFDEASLAELTVSVKDKGVLEPLLVRPKARPCGGDLDTFEIIFGHRRYRAGYDAGLKTVPCMVRELSDREAMEMQLAENLQREDLSPIEEARGYRAMLDLEEADGVKPYDVDSLAAKIGKARQTVYDRLKLLNLTGEAAEAVESGKLAPSIGTLLGGIPGEKSRELAAAEILHPKFQMVPLSVRQSEDLIRSQFRRSLNNVRFELDDGLLYPDAGACTACPKRIASQGGNVCTDIDCLKKKEAAEWSRWALSEAGKNRRVLSMAESAKLGDFEAWNSRYVVAREFPEPDLIHESASKLNSLRWEALVRGQEIEIIIVRDEGGKGILLYDRELAKVAARNNGHKIFKEDAAAREKPKTEEVRKAEVLAEKESKEDKIALNGEIAKEIYGTLREKLTAIGSLTTKQYRVVMQRFIAQTDLVDDVMERRGMKGDRDMNGLVGKMAEVELDHLLVDLSLGPLMDWSGDLLVGEIEPVLNAFGINSKPIIKAVRAAREKEAKDAPLASLKGAKLTPPPPKPAPKTKPAKKESLSDGIVRLLKARGKEGATVKLLASNLGVKPGDVFAWFYTAATQVRNDSGVLAIRKIRKIGAATYAYSVEGK